VLTGNPETDYSAWRTLVFKAIQTNIGPEAGALLDGEGDYENVRFVIARGYRVGGGLGDPTVAVTLTNGMRKGRRTLLSYELYAPSADPAKVALDLIEAFHDLDLT
jgi:hypothetical protein